MSEEGSQHSRWTVGGLDGAGQTVAAGRAVHALLPADVARVAAVGARVARLLRRRLRPCTHNAVRDLDAAGGQLSS